MNENIDLTKILKNCPKGTKLYSSAFGEVEFQYIIQGALYPIVIKLKNGVVEKLTPDGYQGCTPDGVLFSNYDGECILSPSKGQRDWSKFTAPWYKKEKFDPKTLKPLDKVLVRDACYMDWSCGFFSHIVSFFDDTCKYNAGGIRYAMCIPYNEETEHLLGTTEEAPEYYRYWED